MTQRAWMLLACALVLGACYAMEHTGPWEQVEINDGSGGATECVPLPRLHRRAPLEEPDTIEARKYHPEEDC